MIVSIIAAMAEGSRALGLRGGLPWRLPADLARFKRLTMGHAVIMGRVTWEPLRRRGLPGRRVIVLSRRGFAAGPEVAAAASLGEALQFAAQDPNESETFIAGGSQVYHSALAEDVVDRMYLTIVHAKVEADAYFPPYDPDDWVIREVEERAADEENPFAMAFSLLERKRAAAIR